MSQSQTCSCANRNCFHDDCVCFTREGLCSEYCKCRGDCKNIWKHEKEVTKQFVAYTKRKAADAAAAAAQAAVAQALAAQPMALPAREPGPGMVTRGKAQAAKESAVGCKCRGECASRCGCVKRKVKCTSKCKCKQCDNDDGSRFPNKFKAGAGGQGGSRAVEPVGKRPKHG